MPTRDHTERLLRELGVKVGRRGADVSVQPVERLAPFTVEIAGDFSSAAPFILAATLLHGSELLVEGVNVNPLRTGFLDVLERMGANIAVFNRRTVAASRSPISRCVRRARGDRRADARGADADRRAAAVRARRRNGAG